MRTMNIGKLNKRVTIMRYEEVTDALGQSKKELKPYKTVWATFAPTRGREYMELQKIKEELTYKMYCRYIPGITSDLFIVYQKKIYEITSVIDVDLEHKMLEIYCTEDVKKKVRMDG